MLARCLELGLPPKYPGPQSSGATAAIRQNALPGLASAPLQGNSPEVYHRYQPLTYRVI